MAAQTFKIAAIPADGVGKEVVAAGRRVLDTLAAQSDGKFAFDWEEFPWGCEYYEQTGKMMADDGLDTLQELRRHLLRRGGLAQRARPHQPVGSAAEHHPELRPVGQHPAGEVPARRRLPAAQGR